MRLTLEVVPLPVSDVNRALAFYTQQAGFVLDVDYHPTGEFRVVQLTPPGSATSIQLVTADSAGRVRNLHLITPDLAAARAELINRGVAVGDIRHKDPVDTWTGGNPYHRIDIRQSSRHLVVRDGDRIVADTTRPVVLYESGFAPRWYVSRDDIDENALTPAEGQTFWPLQRTGRLLRHRRPSGRRMVLPTRMARGRTRRQPRLVRAGLGRRLPRRQEARPRAGPDRDRARDRPGPRPRRDPSPSGGSRMTTLWVGRIRRSLQAAQAAQAIEPERALVVSMALGPVPPLLVRTRLRRQ